MALDEKIYDLRRDKLKQIEALGQLAYPYRYETTHTIPQILAGYSAKTGPELESPRVNVSVAGRIMSIRVQGKAGFAHLQQGGKRLQIYVRLDNVGEKAFQLYKLLDIGDYIGVKGYLFRTRTNELTVHVEELTFLVKDLLPLPEKWHGLQDVETRYRRRYVDLTMNPEVREVFIKRAKVVQSLRHFGLACEKMRYDAREPARPQLEALTQLPTHLYYFATGPISRRKDELFEAQRFREFLSIYVEGFYDLCVALSERCTDELVVFYPSSVFIDDRPKEMTEYVMAKAAGEQLCRDLTRFMPRITVEACRLSRILTDQTATVTPTTAKPALDEMLLVVRAMQNKGAFRDK